MKMYKGSLFISVVLRRPETSIKSGSKKYIQITVFISLARRIKQCVQAMEKTEKGNAEEGAPLKSLSP